MLQTSDFGDCRNCLGLASRSAARAISQVYDRHVRPYGIRATQFSLLTVLILRGQTPIGILANFLRMDRTTLTRNVALMEKNGWVEITTDKTDARSHLISITRAGEKMAQLALPGWKKAQSQVAEMIGPAGVAGLKKLAQADI
jgi:DNA-binding MarR family transcriptional regulator